MIRIKRSIYLTVLIVLAIAVGVGAYFTFRGPSRNGRQFSENYRFSFENGFQNWQSNGTDLKDPPVEWSIDLSDNLTSHGQTAVKFYLSNLNDAGKIWLERPFVVEPNSNYLVDISYDFASADYGDINLWTIITGVHGKPPRTADDLKFQGDTGNGADSNVGFKWMNKHYRLTIESGWKGEIYVTLGVWGTWETSRIYFIDNVKINIEEK